jgi:uncharacterized protein
MNGVKNKWRVTDVLVALVIFIGVSLLFTIVVFGFFKPSDLSLDFLGSLFILAPVYYLNKKYPLRVFSTLNKTDNLKYFMVGTGMCLLLNAYYGVSARLSKTAPEEYIIFMQYGILGKSLDLVNSLILAPILEETLCRGFIFRILRNRYGVFWGALVSTVVFCIFHGITIESIINTGILGVILVYVYQKTESIPLTALVHSICNAAWLAFIHYGLKG